MKTFLNLHSQNSTMAPEHNQIYTYGNIYIYLFIYVNCFKIVFLIFFQCNAILQYVFEEACITEIIYI
jgi:hypothetical protein